MRYNTGMKRGFALLTVLLLVPLLACGQGGEASSLDVTAFALDGADCLLLSFDGSAVLIDAGREGDAEHIAAELRAQGIAALDALILSQYAPEHAGGAAALLALVPAKTVYLPAYEPDSGVYRAVLAAAGDAAVRVDGDRAVTIGTAGFELWASPIAYDGTNDGEQSLAAAMQYGKHRLVFLGDANGAWLDKLCYGNYNLTCDVLKMPQHGAWLRHDFELIAFSFARHAILTDSAEAPADSKTVNGLKLIGCEVWQTRDGAVRLHSDGKQLTAARPDAP